MLGESILGAIFEQPVIQQAIEKFLSGVPSWLAGMGISVDLVLQSHWKHALVLLAMALSAYAHATKDFEAAPARAERGAP